MQMRSFSVGMDKLLRQAGRQPGFFKIQPSDYKVPQDVLEYLLPLLQTRLLGSDICSKNEASSVLKIYEVS